MTGWDLREGFSGLRLAGSYDLPPQAGIAVYERGLDGLLAAACVYDDIEAPIGHP
jgi:hypothetical protein